MAPRRKRNVLDDSDSDEEKIHHQRKNSLKNYLFPSPSFNKTAPATAATPSPTRKPALFSSSPTKPGPIGSPLSTRLKNGSSAHKSPFSSPEKRKRGGKTAVEEKGRSGDLVALFSKQAEKAQNSPQSSKTIKKADAKADAAVDIDFVLDDIDFSDDEVADSSAVVSSYVGSRAQKRWRNAKPPPLSGQSSGDVSSTPPAAVLASQKFRFPPRQTTQAHAPAVPASDQDLRPWSERFAPTNLDELAVHKKKVADVRRWLDDVLMGRLRQRLLVLKGAAGTGKTTTLRLLAKDMDLDVLEWRNPSGSGAGISLGFSSAAAQFDEFLNRGSRFTQLDLESGGSDSDDPTKETNGTDGAHQRRKIILIEEFPNTFMRSSSGLTGFRNTVLQYLAANTPSLATFAQRGAPAMDSITPVVMIVSETLLTTTSASADSFTAHRLLGPEILRHPGTGLIEFNAIAPTLLARALEIVVQKEARKSGRRRTPGPQVLRRLGEVGDIRSAVASLEFFCVKGDDDGDWGAKVAFSKGRKGPKDAALTRGERDTLEMVSQREASLGVFHAVGKVVYNKRDDIPYPPNSDGAAAEDLPDYLAHCSRPKRPLVAVDTLMDETGTDTHTFISALHENYALSCEQSGPADPQSSLDYINGCIEYLSESDLLCPTWDIFFGGRGSNRYNFGRDSGSHVLRQDEMAFQVAVRGLLFSLPSPVKRSTVNRFQRGASGGAGNGGADQFKMFYPTSLKLWRSREEMEGLVDIWSSKLLRGEMAAQSTGQSTQGGASRALAFLKPRQGGSDARPTTKQGDHDDAAPPLLSLGSSARNELVLERLPYMALIARGRKFSFGSMGIRDLEKIVSFHGVGAPATSAEDAEDEEADSIGAAVGSASFSAEDAWATDKPTDEPSPRKRGRPGRANRPAARPLGDEDMAAITTGLPMCKLYLSDDDIEEVD